MKVSKFLPMVLFLGVLSFSSCNDDDDDDDEPAPTKSELVASKNWMTTGLTVSPGLAIGQNGNLENNLIPFSAACNLDDFWDFNADRSFTFEEGASKCDPNDPSVIASGEWLWNSDETRLILEVGTESEERKVLSVSTTEMVWEFTVVDQGVTYTYTETLN